MEQKGFSLIELLVALAIMGILTAVAYPQYTGYVLNTRRQDAKVALTVLAAKMEQNQSGSGTYTGMADGDKAPLPSVYVVPRAIAQFYNVTIESATADTFEVRATPTGAQARDRCGTLTLTETGLKGNDSTDDCW